MNLKSILNSFFKFIFAFWIWVSFSSLAQASCYKSTKSPNWLTNSVYQKYSAKVQDKQNPFVANKKHFLAVLKQHSQDTLFTETNNMGQIRIGNLFDTKQQYAVLAYQVSDSSMEISVLKIENKNWDTLLQFQYKSYFEEPLGTDIIDLKDFNGDGQLDLKIKFAYWHIHIGENSLLWIFNNNEFFKIEGFEDIVSADFDAQTKLIYSYQSDGCGDMSMQFYVYKIIDNQIKELDDIYCDCCLCNSGYCTVIKNKVTVTVPIDSLKEYVPFYFSEMVNYKVSLCSD